MHSPNISRDNKITFINHGHQIRNPTEIKTPPPPKWGEDDRVGYNPREAFYDPSLDPVNSSYYQRFKIYKDSNPLKKQQS